MRSKDKNNLYKIIILVNSWYFIIRIRRDLLLMIRLDAVCGLALLNHVQLLYFASIIIQIIWFL
jgi:hypothetical protein